MLGRELRAVWDRRCEHRRAKELRELGALGERIVGGELLPGDDDRTARVGERFREPGKRLVGRSRARIHPHRAPEIELGRLLEHVARQADEHRAGRRRERNLDRAPDDPRQILDARRLDCPLDERLRHRHQRVVEQRFEQPVPLLLLAGRQDDRRSRELRVVERAHRIAQPGRDVHVRRGDPAGCAGVAVGHPDHDRFLEAKYELELREVGHDFHDRQLGRTRIAEEMRDALVDEKLEERGAAVADRHVGGPLESGSGPPPMLTCLDRRRRRPAVLRPICLDPFTETLYSPPRNQGRIIRSAFSVSSRSFSRLLPGPHAGFWNSLDPPIQQFTSA